MLVGIRSLSRIRLLPSEGAILRWNCRCITQLSNNEMPKMDQDLLHKMKGFRLSKYNRLKTSAFASGGIDSLAPLLKNLALKINSDSNEKHFELLFKYHEEQKPTGEPNLMLLLIALHYCCSSEAMSHYKREELWTGIIRLADRYSTRSANNRGKSETQRHKLISKAISQDDAIRKLLALYQFGDANLPVDLTFYDKKVVRGVRKVYHSFLEFIYRQTGQLPSIDQFSGIIKSITAPNVRQACQDLTNLVNIPTFVLIDLMYRSAGTKLEFNAKFDIWKDYCESFQQQPWDIKNILETLIHECVYYDASMLCSLLQTYYDVTFLKLGRKTSRIEESVDEIKQFSNHMLWRISYHSMSIPQSQMETQPDLHKHVLKAQEMIIGILNHRFSPSSVMDVINMEGGLGLVTAISKVSTEKAESLSHIFDKRYADTPEHKKRRVAYHYYLLKIYTSKNADELLILFQKALALSDMKYMIKKNLWEVFVRKMGSLGMLDEERAVVLLNQIIDKKIPLTRTLVSELFSVMNTLEVLEESLQKVSHNDGAQYPLLLQVYIKVLYVRAMKESSDTSIKPYKNFPSKLEYARYLYKKTHLRTPALIGTMLFGESYFQPEKLYDIYLKELQVTGEMLPNDLGLSSLMRAAMKKNTSSDSHFIVWGTKYASQIAIEEFKANTLKKLEDHANNRLLLYPTNDLWQLYIQLLGKLNYDAELTEIIRWWEDLKFVPNPETLLDLLAFLPVEVARSYVRHGEKYLSNLSLESGGGKDGYSAALWPWPTEDQVAQHRGPLRLMR